MSAFPLNEKEPIQVVVIEEKYRYSFGAVRYEITLSEGIPKEKYGELTRAIEEILNKP